MKSPPSLKGSKMLTKEQEAVWKYLIGVNKNRDKSIANTKAGFIYEVFTIIFNDDKYADLREIKNLRRNKDNKSKIFQLFAEARANTTVSYKKGDFGLE